MIGSTRRDLRLFFCAARLGKQEMPQKRRDRFVALALPGFGTNTGHSASEFHHRGTGIKVLRVPLPQIINRNVNRPRGALDIGEGG